MISHFFRKIPVVNTVVPKKQERGLYSELSVDFSKLDSTFELLQNTAAETVKAASDVSLLLQDSENRLYSIIDNIDDFVCVKDGEGRWKTLNAFAQGLYGLTFQDYYMKTDLEIAKQFPALEKSLLQCIESDNAAWEAGVSTRGKESFMVGHQMQYFDVIKTPIFDGYNNRKELIVVGRNITDAVEKQKRINACFNALNQATEIMAITDGHGYITFCNDAFIKLFDFKSLEDVVGKKMNVISSGKMNDEIFNDLWNTIIQNKTWQGRILNKDQRGNEILCDITILPVMNGIPTPIYYIAKIKPIDMEN